jgi:Zn-dependent peptidase ImmA (M78 family)
MITLFDRLKKAFPFVGERAATELDLFAFCTDRNVIVEFASEIERGLYVRKDGEDYIFLNQRLMGLSLLYVLAHEIAHLLLHVPSRRRNIQMAFEPHLCGRNHKEAETAVALLLIPLADLETITDHAADEHLAQLVKYRIEYAREYSR